jgi:D-arabinose 1-dehydrogenase-like Zn-dependent alcohol dehydrogenase
MRVRLLTTDGKGTFQETDWIKPDITQNEIEVKAVLTGVCRSDIDMMRGEFGPLPVNMHGHEGLGQVTKVGDNVWDVEVGDYVATRGEPAYADYYNVRAGEFVVVPSAEPKFILEPVACGINVITNSITEIQGRSGANSRLLILGSGFLAYVAYTGLKINGVEFEIDVVGRSNRDIWPIELKDAPTGDYDVVIDLVGREGVFEQPIVRTQALIIDAVGRAYSRKESEQLLWKACTTMRPSPRVAGFIDDMEMAECWIELGQLTVDKFWTRGYNRNTEWQQAFADGADRPTGYSRGYIQWD